MEKYIILIVAVLSGKSGVIKENGEVLIPFVHEKVRRYSEGYFVASKKEQCENGTEVEFWGAYNIYGEETIPFVYEKLEIFKNGFSHAKLNGTTVILDRTGKIYQQSEFDILGFISQDKIFKVTSNGLIGIMDVDMNEIIPIRHKFLIQQRNKLFHDKFTTANESLLNEKGDIVFRAKPKHIIKIGAIFDKFVSTYDDSNNFYCGLSKLNGEVVLPNIYRDLFFSKNIYNEIVPWEENNVFIFGQNSKNKKFELYELLSDGTIRLIVQKDLIQVGNSVNQFVFAEINNEVTKMGLMDSKGRTIIEPKYDDIKMINLKNDPADVLYSFKIEDSFGLLDYHGNELLESKFPKFRQIINNKFMSNENGKSLVFDISGNVHYSSGELRIGYPISETHDIYVTKAKNGLYGLFNLNSHEWSVEPSFDKLSFPDKIKI